MTLATAITLNAVLVAAVTYGLLHLLWYGIATDHSAELARRVHTAQWTESGRLAA